MQEARKTTGVKINILAINKVIQRKIQYEDEHKYSTTSVNINCPRAMSILSYFSVSRDIQDHPHKIKHMARDKR